MKEPMYISHLKYEESGSKKVWTFQSNEDHLKNVALLCEKFDSQFGCDSIGRYIGALHDIGKQQKEFQRYIRKTSGFQPEIGSVSRTPHAYVGALLAKKLYPGLYPIMSYPIASHHTGLYDGCDFEELMKQDIPSDIDEGTYVPQKISLPSFFKELHVNDFNHLIRILFSSLVDADYLDTESFMDSSRSDLRKHSKCLKELLPVLESYLDELSKKSVPSHLNKLRKSIQERCSALSSDLPGFYSLTVPTGGGKTLSSLLWAIKHAIKYDKQRIIIAIPYTSIIVQTASTLRKIFGEENVCEHHSSFDPEQILNGKKDVDNLVLQQQLATENWDYPIIVTTNVQLFESMFSNKPSACRKLHNLANSVLILDEVQMLPLDYLQPIVDGLETYQRLFGVSVLFTTASQPVLVGMHRGTSNKAKFEGLQKVKEIIPDDWNLHEQLRRVKLNFDEDRSDYDTIVNRLCQHNRVLCIVNTRQEAYDLFSRLPDEGYKFHLSRRMCAMHIQETIEVIRVMLKDPSCKIIRVVATQLVEAGVDIDFPVVYRQEAGLDSILQAAGRCNREGKLGISNVYVFKLPKHIPKGYLSDANEARLNLKNVDDWFSPITMSEYFKQLYARYNSFDKKSIVPLLCQSDATELTINFKEASENFHLIENSGINVVVNYQQSLQIVEEIKEFGFSYNLSKKLSKFIVNIHEADFKKLKESGLIEEFLDGIFLVADREQYDSRIGLITQSHWLDEILIQ